MTIIKIEPLESGQHPIQSQSGRKTCWIEGWMEVPSNLESAVWGTAGFCDLVVEGGVLTDVIPTDRPLPAPEPESEPTPEEQLRADVDYIAAMTGVIL